MIKYQVSSGGDIFLNCDDAELKRSSKIIFPKMKSDRMWKK